MRVEPAHLCISLYSWHNWNILAGSGCYCNQAPQMHLGLFLFNSYISSLKLPGSRQFVECYQLLPGNICYHSPKITIPSQLKAELLFFCRLSYQVFWHFSVGSVDKELQKVARNTACFLNQPAPCFHESLCWCREINSLGTGPQRKMRWSGLRPRLVRLCDWPVETCGSAKGSFRTTECLKGGSFSLEFLYSPDNR